MSYYNNKDQTYFTNVRLDMIPYLPRKKNISMLDIGCSGGDTLCYLKSHSLIDVATGVDLIEIAGSNQQNALIDKMIIGDIQKKNLDLSDASFDVIFCGDVLEHLADPWDVLKYLERFLSPEGKIIVSIPNIREIKTMIKIFIKGDFHYAKSGILDKTHLRFFCKKNIDDLLTDSGYQIISSIPSFKTCPLQPGRRKISKVTFGLFNQFLSQQYIVTASKK